MNLNWLIVNTKISSLWSEFGLPNQSGKSCRCPFHDDQSPSFSIYTSTKDGRDMWVCHAGCGKGDSLGFFKKLTNLEGKQAIECFMQRSLMSPALSYKAPVINKTQRTRTLSYKFEDGTEEELGALAEIRKIPITSLRLACDRGILKFANYSGERAWVVTDVTRHAAQYRPLREGRWGNGLKAITAKGSDGNHPIGLPSLEDRPVAFIVEGGPDLLAAHTLIEWSHKFDFADKNTICAISFLGAGMQPCDEDLKQFNSKTVIIWGQSDEPGLIANRKWQATIMPYARSVNIITASMVIPGTKDINDLIAHPEAKSAAHDKLMEVFCV